MANRAILFLVILPAILFIAVQIMNLLLMSGMSGDCGELGSPFIYSRSCHFAQTTNFYFLGFALDIIFCVAIGTVLYFAIGRRKGLNMNIKKYLILAIFVFLIAFFTNFLRIDTFSVGNTVNNAAGFVPCVYRAKMSTNLPDNYHIGWANSTTVIGWGDKQTPYDGYIYTGYCSFDEKVVVISFSPETGPSIVDSQGYIEKIQLCFSKGLQASKTTTIGNWYASYIGTESVSENNCQGNIVDWSIFLPNSSNGMLYCCMDEKS